MPQYMPPQQPDQNMLARLGELLFPADNMSRGMLGRGGYPPITQQYRANERAGNHTAAGTFQYREPMDPNEPPIPIPGRNPRQAVPEQAYPMPGRKPMQQLPPGQGPTLPGRKPAGVTLAEALNRALQAGEQFHQGMDPQQVAALARHYGYTGEYQ
jgi:hypothetical protein